MTDQGPDTRRHPDDALHRALLRASQLLGNDRVAYRDRAKAGAEPRRNVSLFRPRMMHAVLRPRDAQDVQDLVRLFGEPGLAAGLHVVSTGRNWGLGSAEPADDGAVMLDLSDLRSIRHLDREAGWAIIEPGVTQAQLSSAVSASGRMLNVTASSGHTSVLGNALERGVGLRRQRTEDLLGLEVILPDGERIRTGWWPAANGQSAFNPHGLGPSLLHLFTQSNLGIVTAGVIHLLPRPEAQCVIALTIAPAQLVQATETLRHWMAQELISGVLKIYDGASATSYGGRREQHVALVCVSGHARRVQALSAIVCDLARDCGQFSQWRRTDVEAPDSNDVVLRVVERAHTGSVEHNEAMLVAATGTSADAVDRLGRGWLFFLVLIPFRGEALARALEITREASRDSGLRVGTTVNALSADVIDLVVSLPFPPTPDATRLAHQALDRLYERFAAAGLHPYRLDIDHAHWRERLAGSTEALALSRRLKRWLDPNGLLAQGRYG
ncbi:FAD-binding oxidoreductase [Delftia lacustris]|uniref:FAD-binding oxidoreductase n=1 Tax=Delftia lacustris TaxID=558537 RepID=UPI00193B6C26|nr:FAD-binding oxidoreductase [Delftia lacustris]QRI92989.1 FAD-binding oxidoreductase [Delftia lacustris]